MLKSPTRLILGALVPLLAGCATPGLEGPQARAWDRFKLCQADAPSVKLVRIEPDGRFWYQGNTLDMSKMRGCLAENR